MVTGSRDHEAAFAELVEVFNSQGPDAWLDRMPADLELWPDPSFPETGPFAGEQLRRWIREWFAVWRTVALEVIDSESHGNVHLSRCHWRIQPEASGLDMPLEPFTFVSWFGEDGRPNRIKAFFDHDRALAELEG